MATNATTLTARAYVPSGALPTLAKDITAGVADFDNSPDGGSVSFTVSEEQRAWTNQVVFKSDADDDRGETLLASNPILVLAKPVIVNPQGGDPSDGDWVIIAPPLAFSNGANGAVTVAYTGVTGTVDITNPLRPIYQTETGDVGEMTVIATLTDGSANSKVATSAAITVGA